MAASSLAAAETPLTIDQLLAQGWEIVGYASGYDNRTSLILFRQQLVAIHDCARSARHVVGIALGRGVPAPDVGRQRRYLALRVVPVFLMAD
jgi:hypothetical protein